MSQALLLSENSSLLAGYNLKRLRGRGSFGQVWEADAADGATVAVKLVKNQPGYAVNEIRNVRNVCQLSHPAIIRIDKVLGDRDHLLFVMELGDGSLQDLADVSVTEFGYPLSANVVCEYLRQTAAALDFLNARKHLIGGRRVGVQHRDVKPSNILLFADKAKLCDFGLATPTAATNVLHASAGTPSYAAPEVFRGGLSDWTDQYALAVSYCQLRGKLPFSDTPLDFRRDYIRPAPDLSMLTEAERPIIARALAPVPQNRWPSCEDMIRGLLALVRKQNSPSMPERRVQGRRPCPHRPLLRIATHGATGGFLAKVVDLSSSGLGLMLSRPLGIGIEFLFLAPTATTQQPRVLSARVVRSAPQADGNWFAGCRLAFPFNDHEFDALAGDSAVIGFADHS